LAAENGVFAVMGDADYTLPRQSCAFCHVSHCDLTPSPWADIFLKNSSRMLQFGDTFLNVVGVDTLPAFLPDRYDFNAMTRGMPTILLTHTSLPYARLSGDTPVLVLCGDTHGGQVYLPLWIWKHAKRKPDPEHMYGFFRERNKFLVVSNGIGTSHLDLRFGRPPQIIRLSFLPEVK
jgi:predicted MPP superfamily phosphohydrolase